MHNAADSSRSPPRSRGSCSHKTSQRNYLRPGGAFLGGPRRSEAGWRDLFDKERETITGPGNEGRVWRPSSGESSASPTTSYFRGRDRNRILTSQSSVIHSHGIQNKSIPSMARCRWRGVCSSFSFPSLEKFLL